MGNICRRSKVYDAILVAFFLLSFKEYDSEPISFSWRFLELLEELLVELQEELQGGGARCLNKDPVRKDLAQYTQAPPQEPEDPVKVLQGRLAKGEITPEQYQASLKVLQGS